MQNNLEKDWRAEGFDAVECSNCGDYFWRKYTGSSPNRRRKYYVDERGNAWRGKICPKCSKKKHTEYMRERRAKLKNNH